MMYSSMCPFSTNSKPGIREDAAVAKVSKTQKEGPKMLRVSQETEHVHRPHDAPLGYTSLNSLIRNGGSEGAERYSVDTFCVP